MGKNSFDVEDRETTNGICVSVRLLVAAMGFLGTIVLYMNRVNISLAIVCMTEGSDSNDTNATTASPISSQEKAEFDWDSSLQGFILSSFFIGYLLTQVPTGWAIPKFKASAKWLLFGGLIITIVTAFLSPTAARGGWGYLVAIQIVKGMACGTFYPSLQQIITVWAPPKERSRLNSFALSGSALGSVITFASSGFLCENGYAGGWPSVFYTYAICASVWVILWAVLVYDTPAKHPFISEKESLYIQESSAAVVDHNKKKRAVPWGSILTSVPVWAIVVTDFAYQWLWYTALTLLPTYFNDVLKFDIATNGLLNSLPYIVNQILSLGASFVADLLIRQGLSIGVVRKMATTCAMIIPAAFVIGTGFLDASQRTIAVTFLTIAVGFLGFTRTGHLTNQIDIAPRFGAIMMGFSNSIGTVAGIVAPIASGQMTPNGTQAEWRNVFFVAAGLTCLGEIVYLIFGSGEVQPWAMVNDDDHDDDQEKATDLDQVQDGHQDGLPNTVFKYSKSEGHENQAYSDVL